MRVWVPLKTRVQRAKRKARKERGPSFLQEYRRIRAKSNLPFSIESKPDQNEIDAYYDLLCIEAEEFKNDGRATDTSI
jgi:hypothetical protein